jgi:hypothetical protein
MASNDSSGTFSQVQAGLLQLETSYQTPKPAWLLIQNPLVGDETKTVSNVAPNTVNATFHDQRASLPTMFADTLGNRYATIVRFTTNGLLTSVANGDTILPLASYYDSNGNIIAMIYLECNVVNSQFYTRFVAITEKYKSKWNTTGMIEGKDEPQPFHVVWKIGSNIAENQLSLNGSTLTSTTSTTSTTSNLNLTSPGAIELLKRNNDLSTAVVSVEYTILVNNAKATDMAFIESLSAHTNSNQDPLLFLHQETVVLEALDGNAHFGGKLAVTGAMTANGGITGQDGLLKLGTNALEVLEGERSLVPWYGAAYNDFDTYTFYTNQNFDTEASAGSLSRFATVNVTDGLGSLQGLYRAWTNDTQSGNLASTRLWNNVFRDSGSWWTTSNFSYYNPDVIKVTDDSTTLRNDALTNFNRRGTADDTPYIQLEYPAEFVLTRNYVKSSDDTWNAFEVQITASKDGKFTTDEVVIDTIVLRKMNYREAKAADSIIAAFDADGIPSALRPIADWPGKDVHSGHPVTGYYSNRNSPGNVSAAYLNDYFYNGVNIFEPVDQSVSNTEAYRYYRIYVTRIPPTFTGGVGVLERWIPYGRFAHTHAQNATIQNATVSHLRATDTLVANGGLATTTVEASGAITANGGLEATTITANGALEAKSGLTVIDTLAATGGLTTTTVEASGAITANGGLTATNITANGAMTANGALEAKSGLTVIGTMAANGGITGQDGLLKLGPNALEVLEGERSLVPWYGVAYNDFNAYTFYTDNTFQTQQPSETLSRYATVNVTDGPAALQGVYRAWANNARTDLIDRRYWTNLFRDAQQWYTTNHSYYCPDWTPVTDETLADALANFKRRGEANGGPRSRYVQLEFPAPFVLTRNYVHSSASQQADEVRITASRDSAFTLEWTIDTIVLRTMKYRVGTDSIISQFSNGIPSALRPIAEWPGSGVHSGHPVTGSNPGNVSVGYLNAYYYDGVNNFSPVDRPVSNTEAYRYYRIYQVRKCPNDSGLASTLERWIPYGRFAHTHAQNATIQNATVSHLRATDTLVANGGLATTTVEASGAIMANGGLTATTVTANGAMAANGGLEATTITANGALEAKSGLTVIGTMAANGGLATTTVEASGAIMANGGLTATTVTANGAMAANGGLEATTITANGALEAKSGLTVIGTMAANGGITGQDGLLKLGPNALEVLEGERSLVPWYGAAYNDFNTYTFYTNQTFLCQQPSETLSGFATVNVTDGPAALQGLYRAWTNQTQGNPNRYWTNVFRDSGTWYTAGGSYYVPTWTKVTDDDAVETPILRSDALTNFNRRGTTGGVRYVQLEYPAEFVLTRNYVHSEINLGERTDEVKITASKDGTFTDEVDIDTIVLHEMKYRDVNETDSIISQFSNGIPSELKDIANWPNSEHEGHPSNSTNPGYVSVGYLNAYFYNGVNNFSPVDQSVSNTEAYRYYRIYQVRKRPDNTGTASSLSRWIPYGRFAHTHAQNATMQNATIQNATVTKLVTTDGGLHATTVTVTDTVTANGALEVKNGLTVTRTMTANGGITGQKGWLNLCPNVPKGLEEERSLVPWYGAAYNDFKTYTFYTDNTFQTQQSPGSLSQFATVFVTDGPAALQGLYRAWTDSTQGGSRYWTNVFWDSGAWYTGGGYYSPDWTPVTGDTLEDALTNFNRRGTLDGIYHDGMCHYVQLEYPVEFVLTRNYVHSSTGSEAAVEVKITASKDGTFTDEVDIDTIVLREMKYRSADPDATDSIIAAVDGDGIPSLLKDIDDWPGSGVHSGHPVTGSNPGNVSLAYLNAYFYNGVNNFSPVDQSVSNTEAYRYYRIYQVRKCPDDNFSASALTRWIPYGRFVHTHAALEVLEGEHSLVPWYGVAYNDFDTYTFYTNQNFDTQHETSNTRYATVNVTDGPAALQGLYRVWGNSGNSGGDRGLTQIFQDGGAWFHTWNSFNNVGAHVAVSATEGLTAGFTAGSTDYDVVNSGFLDAVKNRGLSNGQRFVQIEYPAEFVLTSNYVHSSHFHGQIDEVRITASKDGTFTDEVEIDFIKLREMKYRSADPDATDSIIAAFDPDTGIPSALRPTSQWPEAKRYYRNTANQYILAVSYPLLDLPDGVTYPVQNGTGSNEMDYPETDFNAFTEALEAAGGSIDWTYADLHKHVRFQDEADVDGSGNARIYTRYLNAYYYNGLTTHTPVTQAVPEANQGAYRYYRLYLHRKCPNDNNRDGWFTRWNPRGRFAHTHAQNATMQNATMQNATMQNATMQSISMNNVKITGLVEDATSLTITTANGTYTLTKN